MGGTFQISSLFLDFLKSCLVYAFDGVRGIFRQVTHVRVGAHTGAKPCTLGTARSHRLPDTPPC